jgi:hypothetical protein
VATHERFKGVQVTVLGRLNQDSIIDLQDHAAVARRAWRSSAQVLLELGAEGISWTASRAPVVLGTLSARGRLGG